MQKKKLSKQNIKAKLQAPFPYFGGKSYIAHEVWKALGPVKHYIEPFFGSGAVLLARPNWNPRTMTETICDKDGFVCNVWRALQGDPDEVAKWCDWPVNHADLSARKKRLIENESYLLDNLIENETWYDVKLAGYWIWAVSCWIGSGLTCKGNGVHKIGQIPHVTDQGNGVHKAYNSNIYTWFQNLSERLRYVRVICGDWTRVCGGNWQNGFGTCGIFFDPPYGVKDRHTKIYHHDSVTIAKNVMEWSKKRGQKKTYRIVIAGYEEYNELIKDGWTTLRWKARGGYSRNKSNENRFRETLYFSPHCLNKNIPQQTTFNFFDEQNMKQNTK